MACLSYTSSPIEFGQDKLLPTDLLVIKDLLLKKCELYNQNLKTVLLMKSCYGNMWQRANLCNLDLGFVQGIMSLQPEKSNSLSEPMNKDFLDLPRVSPKESPIVIDNKMSGCEESLRNDT
mmetsp:Transcript_1290/g.1589  ORF Transcript_1290/g.1589 Transcript_1290/m.1589 type:complete len:121 (-) Transcript_1290:1686-2048(-)